MNIVFMGTPDFAVPSLEILLKNKYDIVGVVTAIDKPAGRGNKIQESPLKKFALANGLRVLQPEKLKSEVFIKELSSLEPDLIIVVAFRMLPDLVWKMPRLGTFNLHGSLLPQYRGAAPINWVIINGEKETGVTTFFIDEEIDTGKIIFYDRIEIGENTTAGELHDEMMKIGAELVLKTVQAIEKGNIEPVNQHDFFDQSIELKAAPKITKETCRINWKKSASAIHNHIRGLSPYPGAWSQIQNIKTGESLFVKIYRTSKSEISNNLAPGQIDSDQKKFIYVGTGDEILSVIDLQLQGKNRLKADEFLRGFKNINDFRFVT